MAFFALNLYKFINQKKFYVDFYTPYEVQNDSAVNLLKNNGSNIFNDNYKFESRMRKKYFIKQIFNFPELKSYSSVIFGLIYERINNAA